MKKIFFLIIFLLIALPSGKAQESQGDDQDFINSLDNIKSPFEDGFPKPAPVIEKSVVQSAQPVVAPPTPPPPPPPVVVPELVILPDLKLEGIMVGEDMQEAIINGQVVPAGSSIEGVSIISVTKQGVVVAFKGKKFVLKVD